MLKRMIENETGGSSNKMKYAFSAIIIPFLVMIVTLGFSEYQKQKTLQIESISQISLIDSSIDPFFKEIKIFRNDEEVSNLSKIDFLLINIGKLDITKEEIVRPVRISFPDNPNIFSVVVKDRSPKDMQVDFNKIDSNIEINFDLMNPADKIHFSVYTDKLISNFTASAGIKNLTELKIKKFEERKSEETKSLPWYIWLGWAFDTFWFLCVLIFYRIRKQIINYENNYTSVQNLISSFSSFDDLKHYLRNNISSIFVDKDIEKIENIIKENTNNYEESKKELKLFIESEINGQLYSKVAYFVFLILSFGFAIFLYKESFL